MQLDFAARHPGTVWNPDAVRSPMPWLIDNLWLRGGLTAVLGPEKTGKSRFICWLLSQMLPSPLGGRVMATDDGRWLNHNGFKKVLYLNAEERTVDVQARVNSYAKYNGFVPSADWPIITVNAAGMQLQLDKERKGFEEAYLRKREYDVVVIDPLRRIHTGDENNNSAMAVLNNDLARWRGAYDLTTIVVHHTPKLNEDADLGRIATWSRGNSDFATLLDGANTMRTMGTGANFMRRELRRMGRFPELATLSLLDYGDPQPDGKPNEGGLAGFLISSVRPYAD
jgi:RecA-family ATPase